MHWYFHTSVFLHPDPRPLRAQYAPRLVVLRPPHEVLHEDQPCDQGQHPSLRGCGFGIMRDN